MKNALLILMLLMTGVGCRGVNRLLGQEPHGGDLNENNINPDDYYIMGTAKTDHDDVHYTDAHVKLANVDVLKNGVWVTLQRPDIADDYKDSYQAFTIPSTGIFFGDLAWTDAQGEHWTSDPACPTGTQYRIHLVKKS